MEPSRRDRPRRSGRTVAPSSPAPLWPPHDRCLDAVALAPHPTVAGTVGVRQLPRHPARRRSLPVGCGSLPQTRGCYATATPAAAYRPTTGGRRCFKKFDCFLQRTVARPPDPYDTFAGGSGSPTTPRRRSAHPDRAASTTTGTCRLLVGPAG